MIRRLLIVLLLGLSPAVPVAQASITIDTFNFDLNQFTGAAVTYRTGGGVSFDGKLWDNAVGVDGRTPGELAMAQAGGDPGDQITLSDRTTPDWFRLTYAGAGLPIGGADQDTFVVYEITSSQTASPVDVEATSWKISFNGGSLIEATSGISKFLSYSDPTEDVYQIAFNLTSFGLSPGDFLKTVYIENKNTGSGTSDPDFIFLALEGSSPVVPEATSVAIWSVLGLVSTGWANRRRRQS